MNPFQKEEAWQIAESFYQKFYNDVHPRKFIFGINPGRFCGGVTGIPFTDPIRLESDCGIQERFRKGPELSSLFVYEVIKAYGGAEKFYQLIFYHCIVAIGVYEKWT